MKISFFRDFIELVLLCVVFVFGLYLGDKRGLNQCYPYAVPHDVAIHEGNQ
ncbi:hypothetical protein [Candidatus Methylobacter oryzae]|uniref:hypothetical protein n=1 Tax=Candidatus Methylobacter oryzae TaxID=2497749 RepID=UPI0012B5126B|nr:hypothetical protein [Candidatus Methylobacter oryzae]